MCLYFPNGASDNVQMYDRPSLETVDVDAPIPQVHPEVLFKTLPISVDLAPRNRRGTWGDMCIDIYGQF